jgi:hypothetical protein
VNSRPQQIRSQWESLQSSDLGNFSQWLALFLGTVSKFLQEEQVHILDLFGDKQLPKVSSLILAEVLLPMKRSLADRLQRIDNPLVTFECYCVAEEFTKRLLPNLLSSSLTEKISSLEVIFGGFIKYFPQYLESEDRLLKQKMVAVLSSICFASSTSSSSSLTVNGNKDIDDEWSIDLDPVEELNVFVEHFISGIDSFTQLCIEVLQRCVRLFGGVNVKQTVRLVVNALQSMTKLLLIKMNNFGIAFGIAFGEVTKNYPVDMQNENKVMIEPYPFYTEECKHASKIADHVVSNDNDRQALNVCVLKALQSVGIFTKSMLSVENKIHAMCSDIMIGLQGNGLEEELSDIVKKSNALLTTISTTSSSMSSAAAVTCGTVFGSFLVKKEDNQIAEIRSFLTANIQSSSMQGIFASVMIMGKKLVSKVSELVLTVSLNLPKRLLTSYSLEDIWNRQIVVDDIELFSQNILPQSVVTQVYHLKLVVCHGVAADCCLVN